jgi:flagellar basal-body rod protein FlgB
MDLHRSELLARLLDVYGERHRVIAQNVANVNTPNYHQLDLVFEDAFARALSSHDPAALQHAQPRVVENDNGPERADGNNVDMDFEMMRLEKNTLLYRTFVQILASRVAAQRSAIAGQ